MKRSQVSFEFILIFALVFAGLVAFLYLFAGRMADIGEEQELLEMKSLANSIKSEAILASSANDNYIRRFDIPAKISGKSYKMDIENDELLITLTENGRPIREYFTVFPMHVKGTFIKDINASTLEHCITKNNYDGIRISRNQASLDASASKVEQGDTFEVFLSLNCVENIRSGQFVIRYEQAKVEYLGYDKIDSSRRELNPLFERYDVLSYTQPYTDANIGRYTFGFLGGHCATGSGNIVRLRFRAKTDAALGITKLWVDTDFQEDDFLKILDCRANKLTKDALPDSNHDAIIEITASP